MTWKRNQHTDEFKSCAAMDAIKGINATGELSYLHGTHPLVIANCKRQLLTNAMECLARDLA